jgi:FMN phosphatase YigB (HAD superfamily)
MEEVKIVTEKNIITKRIIIDIDNTLWDFASVFQERLKKIAPEIPPMSDWEWDFYMEYISIEELYGIVNSIHKEQDVFEPYASATWFLTTLLEKGYELIIASHRHENSREATENFLKKNDLPYTELHLSYNKAILFDSCIAIVDDNPHILDEAKQKGLVCAGLFFPWNKNSGHPLFDSLEKILQFLLKELIQKTN